MLIIVSNTVFQIIENEKNTSYWWGGYVGAAITDFFKEKIALNVLDNFIYNHKAAIKKFVSNKNYQLIEEILQT